MTAIECNILWVSFSGCRGFLRIGGERGLSLSRNPACHRARFPVEVHCARLDEEICGEPSSLYGATHGFVPWHISFRHFFFIFHVDWKDVGLRFVK